MPNVTALTRLLDKGQDSALLRFGLASAYLKEQPEGHLEQAQIHLNRCIELDPTYAAAYKHLARAQQALNHLASAAETLRLGIDSAQRSGDLQAQREMSVFLNRLNKHLSAVPPTNP